MGKTRSKVIQSKYAGYCVFCGTPAAQEEHHLLFGCGIRNLAEEDGIKVPVCSRCHTMGRLNNRIHDNPMAEKLSKMFGQAIWERNLIEKEECTIAEARERFRKRYGQCYY